MRVLVLHSRYLSGPASGENRVAEDEIELLSTNGHDVEAWMPEPAVEGSAALASTAISTVWSASAVREVRRRIRRHRADVVHVHNLFPTLSPAVLRAAASEGAAVVMTLHNYRLMCLPATFMRNERVCEDCLGHVPWRGVRHACFRGSTAASLVLATSLSAHRALGSFDSVTRFLPVSGFVRDTYVRAGFAPHRFIVKPNFTEPARVRNGPGESFLFLGRLAREKGVDTLMQAWRDAPGRLLVVGGGPEEDALRASAPPGVEFAGQVDADQVPEIVRRARALLVPSRWYEAAPRGITEAYAAGVPVIATRLGALEEAVQDETTGLLVAPDDPRGWVTAAERLLDNSESLRLGGNARELWRERFSPEVGLRALEDAYADAVRARTG